MRIAIYMPSFNSGGVQRMHLNLAPHFIAAGHDVSFVVHARTGALAAQVPASIPVVELGANRTLGAILPLARWLQREAPDILVANMGHPNLVALLANRLAGRPSRVIVSQRNHLSHQSRAEPGWQHKTLPPLYRRFLRHADGIIAVSHGVAHDLAVTARLPHDRITVIHNPAVPNDVLMRAAQPVDHPWFNDRAPLAIAAGRLVPMKDYPMMLRAVARVPGLRLAILGEGPLRAPLEQLAWSLGIADRVAFLGFHPNPFALIARACMFLLSSRYEGFGNVLAEALACGTPVVATDCQSGPAEILGNGEFGELVPVGDDTAFAAAIGRVLRDPPDPVRLIARSNAFTVGVAAVRYLALFEEVIAD